ncbi:MAG: hypothetical protein ACRDNW_08380 [Trebonia sp.]
MPGDAFSKLPFLMKLAVLRAVKACLDDANIEVVDWGPGGPVVTDRRTGQVINRRRQ